jgi:hypothetical protein
MGQFKPMVKMETTEPSVILKLKKGGHVNMKKSGKAESGHKKMASGGMSAMGALAGTPALIGRPAVNAPVQAPGKPSMAMRRKAMMAKPAMPMGNPSMPMKKGGKAEGGKMDTAQDKAMIKKAFKQHDMQEHKGGKGTNLKLKKGGKMATGGVTNGQGGYAKGGKATRKVKGYAEGGMAPKAPEQEFPVGPSGPYPDEDAFANLAKMMGTYPSSYDGPGRDTNGPEPIDRSGIVPLPRPPKDDPFMHDMEYRYPVEEPIDRSGLVPLPRYREPSIKRGDYIMPPIEKSNMGNVRRTDDGIPIGQQAIGVSEGPNPFERIPRPPTLPSGYMDEPPMQSGNGNAATIAQLLSSLMGGSNRGNAGNGIPSGKSPMGTSAKGASNRTDTEQLVRALMAGKGSQLDSDRVKSSYGDMAGFAKGGIIKTGGVKNGNGGGYATGGVTKSNGGGYSMGGKASKKAYATGGTVNSGKPVAMPQGRKPPSSPVAINQLAGTFKRGGSVTPAQSRLMKANAAEYAPTMRAAKADSNEKYSKYQKMAGGGLSDKDRKTVEDLSGGAYDKTNKVNRDLEEALNPLSMVKELVGKARNAFSGTMSDKDRDMMRSATPPIGGVTKTKESVTVSPAGKKRGGRAC